MSKFERTTRKRPGRELFVSQIGDAVFHRDAGGRVFEAELYSPTGVLGRARVFVAHDAIGRDHRTVTMNYRPDTKYTELRGLHNWTWHQVKDGLVPGVSMTLLS